MTFAQWQSFHEDVAALVEKMLKHEVRFVSIKCDIEGYETQVKCGKPLPARKHKEIKGQCR